MQDTVEQVVQERLAPDLSLLDQVALQDEARQLRRLVGQLSGRLDEVLAELDGRGDGAVRTNPDSDGAALFRPLQGWWRDAATITGVHAGRDLRRAAILRELTVIGRAVTDGVLAPAQAAVLCRLHGRIPLVDLMASQPQLVEVAKDLNPEVLARLVRHLIATHCEPELDREQARAHERRYLQVSTESDGTVRGRFIVAAEDAEALFTVLEPLARPQGLADKRSAGQRRADAFVEVFQGAAGWMDLPHAGGQRTQISYVINAAWSAGDSPISLPEQLAQHGHHPLALFEHSASAAWTGPQTRPRMEALVCDARLNRLLLDSRGEVVSLHSLRDEITPAQRKAVSARDRHCVAKGCTRPPAFCDVHHLSHRVDGGATTVENLALLCRRHHVLWHRGTLAWHDLHTPWLPEPETDRAGHSPWHTHNPPLIA